MISVFFIVALIVIFVWYTAETPANKKYYSQLSNNSNENIDLGREERSEDAVRKQNEVQLGNNGSNSCSIDKTGFQQLY